MRNNQGFSLPELLVVIALIAILAALTVAGTGSLRSSGYLNNAGNLVSDQIHQARRLAQAKNAQTLLVMAKDARGAFRLLTVCERAAGSPDWNQVTRWEVLPEGIGIDASQSLLHSPAVTPPPPPLTQAGRTIPASDYAYQVFFPDGRLLAADNPVLFVSPSAGTNNFYRIVINASTGIPIIERP